MLITLLGTGTPILDLSRHGPAVSIAIDDDLLLFDAGRGVVTQLMRTGISPQSVNPIFITHHHADHIEDLGNLIISAWHSGREESLLIFGPKGTTEIVAALLNLIFDREIEFRLTLERALRSEVVDIRDIVKVTDVEPGLVFNGRTWKVLAEYVEHGHGLGLSQNDWPCLGYRVESQKKSVALSGDAIACDGLSRLAQGADVLIQCCYLAEAEITNNDSKLLSNVVIASSIEAGKIAARAGVKKLVLTHFRKKSEDMMHFLEADIRKNYDGDLCLGKDLMTIEF